MHGETIPDTERHWASNPKSGDQAGENGLHTVGQFLACDGCKLKVGTEGKGEDRI